MAPLFKRHRRRYRMYLFDDLPFEARRDANCRYWRYCQEWGSDLPGWDAQGLHPAHKAAMKSAERRSERKTKNEKRKTRNNGTLRDCRLLQNQGTSCCRFGDSRSIILDSGPLGGARAKFPAHLFAIIIFLKSGLGEDKAQFSLIP